MIFSTSSDEIPATGAMSPKTQWCCCTPLLTALRMLTSE